MDHQDGLISIHVLRKGPSLIEVSAQWHHQIPLEVDMNYGEQRSNALSGMLHKVVVLSIGSLEQHGQHLPMLTDSLIGDEIARRARAELSDEALFLPMIWTGASDHHLALPGAISISNDTYTQFIKDIIESLITHGFRRILLLNSHGGNSGPAGNAIYQTQMKHRDLPGLWLVLASWFTLAGPQIAALSSTQQKHVTHACELETSMLLYLRPDLVNMDAAKGGAISFDSAFWSADSSIPNRITVPRSFEQITSTGALGHPELATPEKGEELFVTVTKEVVALIRELSTW